MTTETDNTNPIKTKPRRWFRFRLRTLLVMVTLLSIPLGWVGWELDQRRSEKAVIAWVEKMDGKVRFQSGSRIVSDESWWTRTKDKWLGERVRYVSLVGNWIDKNDVSDLSPLAELTSLRFFEIKRTLVSEEQVHELRLALPNCKIN
jgi:hypothetical protein